MKFTRQMICCAALGLALVLVGTTQAAPTGLAGGKPWQIGDVVVCFGSGTCNVLRISGSTATLIDQFSDGLTGDTRGVTINNTLHAVVTDNGGGGASKVVVYSIASLNPLTAPAATTVAHTPVNIFTASGGPNSNNAQAVVVNSVGHIFVGNAGSGTPAPSIVELNPDGTPASPSALSTNPLILPSNCTDTKGQLLSMDLSADGLSMYLTSNGGSIQKLTLSSGICTPFANFGSGVTLYDIKDIPPGALGNVSPNCNGTACPSDETILVVAKGFTDPDASEGTEPSIDPDAVNICTNQTEPTSPLVSCALLLDTNPNPGLTAPLWQAGNHYFTLGAPILDPSLHLQTVFTAGTSGSEEPTFNDATPGTTIDNAVKWTDIVQPTWQKNNPYTVGALPAPNVAAVANTYFVDPNGNLQTVTLPGTSGPTEPSTGTNPVFWSTSPGGTTIDGLQWRDQGTWQATHTFAVNSPVGDSLGHVHAVLTAGTSGPGALPAGGWNDTGGTNLGLTVPGVTIDNAAIWTNQGPVVAYTGGHAYALNTLIVDGSGHAQQAVEPGTSGASSPSFSPTTGGKTIDNAVTWTDQGQEFWHPSFAFGTGAVVVDPAGHVQLVTTAGTSGPTQPIFNDAGSTTTDGLQWIDLGVPGSWAAGGSPSLNAVILDSNAPQHVQQVIVAGTSGGSAPAFSTTGGYILDGSVVWLDRGVNTYQPSHSYNVGDAFFDAIDVQQATSAGTSGASAPTFANTGATVTPDNAVVWTDEGALTWQHDHNYSATTPATTYIVDPANHVQQVTVAGTSGPGQPTFNDGGITMDATPLVWTDQGRRFWHPSAYATNAVVVDRNGHVQFVTTAGTSGPTQPTFNDAGSTTTDGLQWTDQGAPGAWAMTTVFSANQFILDNSSPPHVQQVVVKGTSGGSMPTFSVTGGYTVDGSPGTAVVWLDRGISTHQPTHPYNVGDAFFDAIDVQQATSAGTSGASSPTFLNTAATVTPDNAVVWTDEGALTWQNNFNYMANTPGTTYIVDPSNHVQQVTTAGMSGSSIPLPFNDGGTVIDGLVWLDVGPTVSWTASTSFPSGTLFVDPGSFLQKVTAVGITGTPNPPIWNDAANGMTVDGLQWTDQGHLVWTAGAPHAIGDLISDPATHAQKVYEAGTSGSTAPTFNDGGGNTVDNAVTWTESHPSRAASQAYVLGAIVLDGFSPLPQLQQVTLAGITGPGNTFAFSDTGQTTIDGLQWTNQPNPATSVVARYPVAGMSTLQALTLDPLVADCTLTNCSSTLTKPTVSNFWLGDSGSANFYKLDFKTGTPHTFSANAACPGCSTVSSIQGLRIYGAEGANQADLTKLFTGSLNSPSFTASVKFPPLVSPFTSNDINTWTLTEYAYPTGPAPSSVPVTLYASLIAKASAPAHGGDNSGATDPLAGNAPCEPTTTDPTKCVVWKADLLLPGGDYLSENVISPTGIDNGTDIFVDLQYDITTSVGSFDPIGKSSGSVHSLHEITTTFSNSGPNPSGCFFLSPAPEGACFKSNRTTLPFVFQCTGLTPTQMANLSNKPGPPLLSLVETFTGNPKPAPQTIFLTTTNGKAPFRYNSSGNQYVFNWSPNRIAGTFRGCTFDPTNTVQTFCVDFKMKTSCP